VRGIVPAEYLEVHFRLSQTAAGLTIYPPVEELIGRIVAEAEEILKSVNAKL
jgi:hypothetical protein